MAIKRDSFNASGGARPLYLGRPFPVDRRRVVELERLGFGVVDELAGDWRGEFLVLMDRNRASPSPRHG